MQFNIKCFRIYYTILNYTVKLIVHQTLKTEQDHLTLWAAIIVAFYGCLWVDKFTVDLPLPDHIYVLCLGDLAWFSQSCLPYLVINLKHTKTLLHGCKVTIGYSGA